MITTDTLLSWKRIGRESLWGPRGIIKTGNLWFPLAIIVSTNSTLDLWAAWLPCVILFVAASCRTIAVILANDLTDRHDDIAAGKERWILRLRPATGIAIVCALIVCGIGILTLSRAPTLSIGAYLIAVTLGLLHSIRPFRFKERGIKGMISYGLHGVFAYVVVTWFWLGKDVQWLAALSTIVFLEKWVNLHFHQIIDFESDSERSCRTFAVQLGLERTRATLQLAAVLSSISMATTLIMVMCTPGLFGKVIALTAALICLAVGYYIFKARKTGKSLSPLMQELPWHYLGLTYSVFTILPLLLLSGLALQAPPMLLPLALAALTSYLVSVRFIRYHYA